MKTLAAAPCYYRLTVSLIWIVSSAALDAERRAFLVGYVFMLAVIPA